MKLQLRKSTTILSISLIAGVFSLGFVISQLGNKVQAIGDSGRLVTIHDRGQEKVLLTESQTIADVLKEAEISVDSHDAVEPALDQKLVAREYHVNIYRARPVTIVDGPMRQKVVTPYQTAERIIHDAGIELYDEDEATMSRNDNILADGAGLQLTVDRATAFNLNLFGTTTTVRTQGTTLADMLKEKGITLQSDDRASVDLSSPIVAGMDVKIWREGKQTVTAEVAVPFATEQIRDADREVGYKAVQTEGKNGLRNVTYEIEIKNGVEVSRVEIVSLVTQEAVKQVEVIGSKYKGAYTTPSQNESITWSYLLQQGFTREQTAGIMGNLQQEHGFNTSGDGLAQWTGSRKAALLSRPDPYNIYTQLDFLMYELNGSYRSVQASIKASTSIDEATIIFQNKFERCGMCVQDRRIQFAYNIYASH